MYAAPGFASLRASFGRSPSLLELRRLEFLFRKPTPKDLSNAVGGT